MESFLAHVLEPPSSDAVSAAVSEGCGKEWGGEGRGGEGRGGEGGEQVLEPPSSDAVSAAVSGGARGESILRR